MNRNFLSNIFEGFGDALEKFNPSAFRFLAAFLPYATPIPVAWLTAHSSSEFLSFTPTVAFVFVFALEGIGLWFTTMLVDAVVDFVRSRNFKAIFPVLLLGATVAGYIFLLVSLNVTLEEAAGNSSPALSRVITLLCFLPLLTGIGNGYYKLKLETKTQLDADRQRKEERDREDQLRREEMEIRNREISHQHDLERLRLRQDAALERSRLRLESSRLEMEGSRKVSNQEESFQESSKGDGNFPGKVPDWRKVREKLSREQMENLAHLSPDGMRQYASQTGFTYKTISNWRKNARNELGMRND